MSGPATGGRVGGALASVLADVLTKHKAASANVDAELRDRVTRTFMERGESELAPLMGSLFGHLADHDETPPQLRAFVEQITEPQHQTDFILSIIGVISFAITAMFKLGDPDVQVLLNKLWAIEQSMPLSAPEAALAELRGAMSHADAAAEAELTGYNAERFATMVENTGEPPGIEQLLFLWRREQIDEPRLERGIRQSRVRNEWVDAIKALRVRPMSPEQAIEAAVQGQLDDATARHYAEVGGLDPADYDPLYGTAGNPPGVEQMLDLLNRGLMTEEEVTQGIRESRYKNKYIPTILASRRRLPPERTVVMMVAHGALNRDDGIRHLLNIGFDPTDAAALVDEGLNRKNEKHKDLAESTVTQLYEDQAIDQAKANELLGVLGYDPGESAFILALADHRRVTKYQDAAIGRAHSLYVAHHIERDEASRLLDQVGVPHTQRDAVVQLWDWEREANAKDLTPAQITAAYRAQIIDQATFRKRMGAAGYAEADVAILDELAMPTS